MNNAFYAVVTARAGSSLAGKNTRLINGKPLFMWSVYAALGCSYIDRVIVSSNDPEVWTHTLKLKSSLTGLHHDRIVLSCRPEELSGPNSPNEEAVIQALEAFDEPIPGYTILLQPTSPVRNGELLQKCIDKFLSNRSFGSLFTAQKHTPFFYAKTSTDYAIPLNHSPCNRKMRQDLTDKEWYWHDSGNVYITRTDLLRDTRCRLAGVPCIYETDFYQSWQIDNEHDFDVLEALSKKHGSFVDGF